MDSAGHRIIPPEMWCEVFLQMDTKTRLGCKLVCRDFYNILAHDDAFKEDRCLHIRSCYLHEAHPVVLALTSSSTKFERLTIGAVEVDPQANLDEFWSNLGLTVTDCKVVLRQQPFLFEVLSRFFNVLKELSVDSIYDLLEELKKGNGTKWSFSSVECFSTKDGLWSYRKIGLRKLLNLMPNVRDVELPSGLLISKPGRALKALKANAKILKSLPYENGCEDLFDLTDLRHIRFESSFEDITREDIERAVSSQKNLKSYSLCFKELVFYRKDLVTEVKFCWDEEVNQRLDALQHFSGLKVLELIISDSANTCFFGHSIVNLTPEDVFLVIDGSNCLSCFTALMESLKRMKTFKFYSRCYLRFLSIITRYQHRFTSWFEFSNQVKYQDTRLLVTIDPFTNLTFLSIALFDVEDTTRFSEYLPKLKKLVQLHIFFQTTIPSNVILKFFPLIGENLLNLKEIRIECHPIFEISNTFQLIENFSPRIEDIEILRNTRLGSNALLTINKFQICEEVIKLFNKRQNLKTFVLWRGHFHRIEVEKCMFVNKTDIGPSMSCWNLSSKLDFD